MKIEKDEIIKTKSPKAESSKVTKIVITLIVLTLLIVIGIVILISVLGKEKLVVTVDGKKVSFNEDTFLFTENNGDVYLSIKDIAPLVGYEAHNGEYKVNSEDISKMYIEAKDGTETTSFFQNSTLISKIAPDAIGDYENIQINQPVTSVNGKLYISSEGFMQGFNSIISYNKDESTINIQTLPYLVDYYKANVANFGYDKISEDFNNQKALIYGMLVASKEATGKFGVVSTKNGEEIISPKYNKIEFLEGAREFIITNSSEKVGIAYASGATKINVLYDEVKVLDSRLKYYLVKSNEKYGVLSSNEELVINIEYNQIGVDLEEFQTDKIKSQYILYDKVIPVCLNKKWGLFDINGNKLVEPEYDTFGCINTDITDQIVNNVMTIGEEEVIVVSKGERYGGLSTRGDLIIPLMCEYIYSITSGGETTYYMVFNGTVYNAIDYLKIAKERLGYNKEENNTETNINNNVNANENTSTNTNTTTETNQTNENTNTENNTNGENSEENTNQNQETPEVKAFNAQFSAYQGERSRGSVRSLLSTVDESNKKNEHKVVVEINENTYTDNVANLREDIKNETYTVTMERNTETGYVEKIIIK
ncbi:MAG: hypothetical protein HFJ52_04575 [Clostridia bacterium]|nr:hypothetical protein [Clostridia bacterium]